MVKDEWNCQGGEDSMKMDVPRYPRRKRSEEMKREESLASRDTDGERVEREG